MIVRRSESVISHTPSRRKNDKIANCHTRSVWRTCQNGENTWIHMIEGDCIHGTVIGQIIFVRGIVAMPSNNVEWRTILGKLNLHIFREIRFILLFLSNWTDFFVKSKIFHQFDKIFVKPTYNLVKEMISRNFRKKSWNQQSTVTVIWRNSQINFNLHCKYKYILFLTRRTGRNRILIPREG